MFGEPSSPAAGRVEAEGKHPQQAGFPDGSAQRSAGGLGSPGSAIAVGGGGWWVVGGVPQLPLLSKGGNHTHGSVCLTSVLRAPHGIMFMKKT